MPNETDTPVYNAHPAISTTCARCDNCTDCCDCITCPACNRTESAARFNACRSCDGCENCCECIFCDRCGIECRTTYCIDCNKCESCCSCSCEPSECNVEYKNYPLTFHTGLTYARNPSSRYLSVEIEVCNINYPNQVNEVCERWKSSIVSDGSLPDSGFEINTAPSSGDAFVRQITELCCALNNAGAEVNDRCGLHVHIDARKFRAPTMRKLLKLYIKLERALFLLVPHSRRVNSYCEPCETRLKDYIWPKRNKWENGKLMVEYRDLQGSKETREKISQYTYGDNVKTPSARLKNNKYGGERYRAFNLVSWYHRGTIECRLFGGTTNPKKIICWAILWAGILDYAKREKEITIDAIPGFDQHNPLANLLQIAPTGEVREWIKARYETYGKTDNDKEINSRGGE